MENRGVMESRGVLIGSIIFVFGSFILMIGLLVYETYKEKAERERLLGASHKAKPRVIEPVKVQDFSMYRTVMGNEGREMVEIPEGPFTMGHDQGDPDEAPAHPVYLKAFFIDLKEVTQSEYDRFVKMTKRGEPQFPVFEEDISKLITPRIHTTPFSPSSFFPFSFGWQPLPRPPAIAKPIIPTNADNRKIRINEF